ncbi:MAG: long-chain fatty acid--CoA ligase [Deltaproteobacteria bacterium HGW-Deltaproteobacteria-19]|nr:MAG: long-chain fatty acid--CoA ligase [Deltaproteobacteria bacterium HGW-Deltaproteobacteria-19]
MVQQEQIDNLALLWEKAASRHADKPYIGTRNPSGTYDWVTFREVDQRIRNLRGGLSKIGVGRGDAVGIIANNRLEWVIAAFATYSLGARYVTMYESELIQTCRYIVNDASVKVLLVSKQDIFEKVKDFPSGIPSLQKIILIEGQGKGTMAELERTGASNPVKAVHPDRDEIAGLIYTSGTTGDPKGVLISHWNFCSNVMACLDRYPHLSAEDRCMNILPWAHSYAQTVELYVFTINGGSIGIMGSTATIVQDMAQIRPTFVVAVPRVFNKIFENLHAAMNEKGGLAKSLFFAGLKSAKARRNGGSGIMDGIVYAIADRIVFQKIRDRFGGRLREALTGAAAISPEISYFFDDIGINLYESYGMTELSPGITANAPTANKKGSVGRPLMGVKVVIDQSVVEEGARDGEIVVYGPNVMRGYHNKPELTQAAMTPDGGIRTGDRGRLDEDGFLYITGRIKEQFKLENAKFVFPAAMEEDITLNPLIQNALIYGDNRPYTVCLVVPDPIALKKYAEAHNLSGDPGTLSRNRDVQGMIGKEISRSLAGKYGGYEIPKKFVFIHEPFSVDNGMITQTMKMKRKVILDKHMPEIEALYSEA